MLRRCYEETASVEFQLDDALNYQNIKGFGEIPIGHTQSDSDLLDKLYSKQLTLWRIHTHDALGWDGMSYALR